MRAGTPSAQGSASKAGAVPHQAEGTITPPWGWGGPVSDPPGCAAQGGPYESPL